MIMETDDVLRVLIDAGPRVRSDLLWNFSLKIIFVTGGSAFPFTPKINPYGLENVLNKIAG